MTALPPDAVADLYKLVAELEQRLDSSFAAHDAAIAGQAKPHVSTRMTVSELGRLTYMKVARDPVSRPSSSVTIPERVDVEVRVQATGLVMSDVDQQAPATIMPDPVRSQRSGSA